ncbi:MAG: hypothetical protein ACI4R8_04260 [Candidatus Caccovivens sp.]
MKHIVKILCVRGVVMGAIAAGLCIAFPFTAVLIAVPAVTCLSFAVSAQISIETAKEISAEIQRIPVGDMYLHEFKMPGTKFENAVINLFERSSKKERKKEKESKKVKDVEPEKEELNINAKESKEVFKDVEPEKEESNINAKKVKEESKEVIDFTKKRTVRQHDIANETHEVNMEESNLTL